MSNTTMSANGVVVVTHVQPYQMGPNAAPPYSARSEALSAHLRTFRRGEPKALGTVQIMLGVVTILMGGVTTVGTSIVGVFSGIFIWGAVIYIIAGALTVAADNNLNKCLVNGALGMNIIAVLTAVVGISLYAIDCSVTPFSLDSCGPDVDTTSNINCVQFYQISVSLSTGVSAVLLVLSVLEFWVAITVSAFAGQAICNSPPESIFYIENQPPQGNSVTINPILIGPHGTNEGLSCPKYPGDPGVEAGAWEVQGRRSPPPEYTAVHP